MFEKIKYEIKYKSEIRLLCLFLEKRMIYYYNENIMCDSSRYLLFLLVVSRTITFACFNVSYNAQVVETELFKIISENNARLCCNSEIMMIYCASF